MTLAYALQVSVVHLNVLDFSPADDQCGGQSGSMQDNYY